MWDVFMDQFEVLATQAPVMLVAGNHERDFPDSGDRYGTNIDSGVSAGLRHLHILSAAVHDAALTTKTPSHKITHPHPRTCTCSCANEQGLCMRRCS